MKLPIEKLGKSFVDYPEFADFDIMKVPARSLMDYRRFDFAAKLFYIDHYVKGMDMAFAKELYLKQVSAITGNTNQEKGNPEKNNPQKFIDVFNRLINNIREFGFDENKSLIPVDSKGYVLDGAHRLSIAVYFNYDVTILKFKDWNVNYQTDWTFLKKHFLEEKYMDFMALEYCKWHQNLYMACIWPQSFLLPERKKKAEDYIKSKVSIVYKKIEQFNLKALHNFLLQIYGHMSWIGSIDNHFSGVEAKVREVYAKQCDTVEFILMQADSYDTIFALKQEIRKIYGIGLSSVHMTDNIKETRQIANLIYNQNSMHHLRYGEPDKYKKSYLLLSKFKEIIKENKLNLDDFVVDSSAVMAIYGIREAADLDFYTTASQEIKIKISETTQKLMEDNDKYLNYHKKKVVDLLYNPNNFFLFEDVKLLCLSEVKFFKENKGEQKDLNDVKLINSYIDNGVLNVLNYKLSSFRHFIRVKYHYEKNKIKMFFINLLKRFHLYDSVKSMYHIIRK